MVNPAAARVCLGSQKRGFFLITSLTLIPCSFLIVGEVQEDCRSPSRPGGDDWIRDQEPFLPGYRGSRLPARLSNADGRAFGGGAKAPAG
jgi:hypothetical protein